MKLWNALDEAKVRSGHKRPLELTAKVDTGAALVVLPADVARKLGLLQSGSVRVTYASGADGHRTLLMGLRVAISGRTTTCDAILEPERKGVLIGELALEGLDLIVDPRGAKVVPRPESGNEPTFELE